MHPEGAHLKFSGAESEGGAAKLMSGGWTTTTLRSRDSVTKLAECASSVNQLDTLTPNEEKADVMARGERTP